MGRGPATSWRWESLLKVVLEFEVCSGESSGICFPVGPPYRDGAAQPNSAFTPPLPPPQASGKPVKLSQRLGSPGSS